MGCDGGSRRRVDSLEVSSVYVLKKCCFEEEGIVLVLTGLAELTHLGCEWWEEGGEGSREGYHGRERMRNKRRRLWSYWATAADTTLVNAFL